MYLADKWLSMIVTYHGNAILDWHLDQDFDSICFRRHKATESNIMKQYRYSSDGVQIRVVNQMH